MKSISHGMVSFADQVGHEEHRALQHADQQQVGLRVVARELGAQLGDPSLRASLVTQHLGDQRSWARRARVRRSSRLRIPLSAPRSSGYGDRAPLRGRGPATAARARRSARRASSSRAGELARAAAAAGPAARSAAARSTSTRSPRGQLGERVEVELGRDVLVGKLGQQLVELGEQLGGARKVARRPRDARGAAPASPRAGSGFGAARGRRWSRRARGSSPRAAHHARVSAAVSASSGRTRSPSLRGFIARERARPRRGCEPVDDGLGLVGQRVAGRDRRGRRRTRAAAA